MPQRRAACSALWILVAVGSLPCRALADDLASAMALAYQNNPNLLSQRAQLQATDETYVQAEAGFRPTANLQTEATYSKAPESSLFDGSIETESNSGEATLSLSQPVYTGGRTTAQLHAAEAQIRAGREQLRSTEASVMLSVVQAYSDVLRDRAILKLQRDSFTALTDATNEIRARYQAGANTVTDKQQAETQQELARALVDSAQAQLESSIAEYVATVGQSPGDLSAPPVLPGMAKDLADAMDIAEVENSDLRRAQYTESSNRAQVQEARAGRRPTVTVNAQYGYSGTLQPFDRRSYMPNTTVTATLSQPLFAGGAIASQVRQAIAQDSSALAQVEVTRRTVIQSVSQAWAQARAARANIASGEAAVTAAQQTFDGMRVEYRAGLRTTLDVLVAQENLRDAQVSLENARHDQYVADATVLDAIGRLDPRRLLSGQPLYQPEASFRKVKQIGAVPWQFVPATIDALGTPPPPQPPPLPEPIRGAGPASIPPPQAGATTP